VPWPKQQDPWPAISWWFTRNMESCFFFKYKWYVFFWEMSSCWCCWYCFFLWHEIIDGAFSDSLIASAVCGMHPQVMCLKESRKLLAYLEKEFGKAQLGFQPLFLVVHGLQLVYSISKTLLQSRRTTINASSRAISIGCHWYLRIVDGGWRPYKIIWIHSTSIPLYPTVSHHIPLYPTMSQ
jgi:hypothetical protein